MAKATELEPCGTLRHCCGGTVRAPGQKVAPDGIMMERLGVYVRMGVWLILVQGACNNRKKLEASRN
ncbi:PadR family transcriptional regulator [Anopheles sinensis]|uniref:PadR family transcriptional regulator n=1 Tax=Anopheles sinensis TaxID=74873 RepID=A0A084WTI9_ANOSI|nr:PadR family transcriptional regulator [Anopheles sinensis]